ncbi:hypothetical protein Pmani_039944 [Petrolisthes manimaculis]|uniref:Uncharacterized protein n=1 Tax=Petrolisthes manimaculis TaxID=1843537 RepID=A0AAE1ND97_9EUCA|nr:hypothetical protein Pmani_039944 [Petrolisthes manimaculis]
MIVVNSNSILAVLEPLPFPWTCLPSHYPQHFHSGYHHHLNCTRSITHDCTQLHSHHVHSLMGGSMVVEVHLKLSGRAAPREYGRSYWILLPSSQDLGRDYTRIISYDSTSHHSHPIPAVSHPLPITYIYLPSLHPINWWMTIKDSLHYK